MWGTRLRFFFRSHNFYTKINFYLPSNRTGHVNLICTGSVAFAKLPAVHAASTSKLSSFEFDKKSNHVLEYLFSAFEDLSDNFDLGPDYDVSYSDGVLTIKFGDQHGTYVLNKQSPNKQIWLSSPKSGPKRYDYISNGSWVYNHDQTDLLQLLSTEVAEIVHSSVSFKAPSS